MNSRYVKKILFLAVISFQCFSAHAQQPQNSVSKAEWLEDLALYESTLRKKHIDLFHTISEDLFSAQLKTIGENYNGKNYQETLVDMMRLTRQIGDGHTTFPLWGSSIKQLPLQFTQIKDDYYVTGTTDDHIDLLGSKLAALNSVSIAELERKIGEVVPFVENKHSKGVRVALNLQKDIILKGLGVVEVQDNTVEIALVQDSKKRLVSFDFVDSTTYSSTVINSISYRNSSDFEVVQTIKDKLWFAQHRTQPTILINFGRYPNFDEAVELGQAAIDHIQANNTKSLIIDLRDNFGGDFFMGLTLASYLNLADSIDWKNGVFVLANGKTFSAAMSNTANFREILNAKMVGQPTGASPCGYQDMGSFVLPNSKLEVTYSKRKFCFEHSKTNAIEPDIPIKVTIEDYIHSKDKALDWIVANTTSQ